MAIPIEMPQLSSDGESAALVSWLVKAGDTVEAGDVIAELETEKSTVELEAPADGVVAEILVAAGTEDVAPGTLLATLDGDSEGAFEPLEEATPSPSTSEREEARNATAVDSRSRAPADAEDERTEADPSSRASTPLARRAAESHGVDLAALEGSGPGGRILEADVLRRVEGDARPEASARHVESRAEAREASPRASLESEVDSEVDGFETRRLSAMRKTIARRMAESKREIPHFYLSARCSMDPVAQVRAQLNAELAASGREAKISVNDFVVRAAALALRDVPDANVSFAGDAMRVFERVDVAVAVATDGGLVTPVVREADRKGLTALATEIKALAERAREGRLRPEEYQDGTFTISNLGMYGIESVYPILNPPQACILGVGAAEEQPVVRAGELGIGRVATITLAADHRAVDGAVGARLLAAIRTRLEDPLAMIL